MTLLVVDRKEARLSLDGGAMRLQAGSECRSLPLGQIERLIVRGAATIDTGLLSRLWMQGTGVLLLSGRRGEPTARFHGQGSKDVRRRITQTLVACDGERAIAMAKPIVAAKLAAQSQTLSRLARHRPSLRRDAVRFETMLVDLAPSLNAANSLDAVRGYEGAAARQYWGGLAGAFAPSLGFDGRNRRPPRDPVNAALSLAYTIATFEAGKQAQALGLDPMIGFLHAPSFGRDSLACDLVEPLRPRVDLWIEALFRERQLRGEHFAFQADGACLMGKAGRQAFYEALDAKLPSWARWLRLSAGRMARSWDAQEAQPIAAFEEADF